MRIDLLLNKLCLVKTRSNAKKACDNNLVELNGAKVKASQKVHSGDDLSFTLFGVRTSLKIIEIPAGNVSKKNATQFYEITERDRIDGTA